MTKEADIIAGWQMVIELIDSGSVADIQTLRAILDHWSNGYANSRVMLSVEHMRTIYRVLSLPKNVTKGDWDSLSLHELFQLKEKELQEFKDEVILYTSGMGNIARVESEGGDISAFVAMIVDKCRKIEEVKIKLAHDHASAMMEAQQTI